MRTMPSATEVTTPSLRASADSLTFSMRVLISSLISDGLSVVVAIALLPGRMPRARHSDFGCVVMGASCPGSVTGGRSGRSPDHERLLTAHASLRQRRLQPRQLAAQRAVDDHVAGGDDRAADQGLVDRGLELDLAAEALAQRR